MANAAELAQQWIDLHAALRDARKQVNALKAEYDEVAGNLIQTLIDNDDDQVVASGGTVVELRQRSVMQGYKAEWMSPAVEQYLADAQGPPSSEEIVAAVFNARPRNTTHTLHIARS